MTNLPETQPKPNNPSLDAQLETLAKKYGLDVGLVKAIARKEVHTNPQ